MKTSISLLVGLALSGSVTAQTGYSRQHYRMLDDAKAMLDGQQWEEAAKLYKKLLPVDSTFADVHFELAQCLVKLPGQRSAAAEHFAAASRHGNSEALYHMAVERHVQQRFDEAVILLNRYRATGHRSIPDVEVDRRIAMAQQAKTMIAHPVDIKIRNMGAMVNSSAHDYCPVVTADGSTMYFTSRREAPGSGPRDATGRFYEDIYRVDNNDGIWSAAVNVGPPLNTELMDATVGLSADGNEMIIYRTGKDMVSGDLFITQRVQGKWKEPVALTERINSSAHEPSATISPDGSEIYFTSDRPGGYGGRDLYRIRRLPNGEWSLPLNLGPSVNTPYDEDAPFLHSDGTTLFFSSNGHNTMGGYDIFKVNLLDPDMNVWGMPENLGYPLNTVNDDIYFHLSADGETGWFSSERPGGLGGQDIYSVRFPSSQIEYQLVRGLVSDGADAPIKARLLLKEQGVKGDGAVFATNARTGRYVMVLRPGSSYNLRVEAPGYRVHEQVLVARPAYEGSKEVMLDILLVPSEEAATVIGTE